MEQKQTFICAYESPLGQMWLAAHDEGITGVWFAGQKYDRRGLPADAVDGTHPHLTVAVAWLERYFAGERPGALPPLCPAGTAFQQRVWEVLRGIPYGETMTYGEIAAQLAQAEGKSRMSAQAVGGAVGRNPVAILIPCHRVIGADGSLTGYAGGIERKRALLELENGF